jgi:ribosomal protein L14E/L6E/L27E
MRQGECTVVVQSTDKNFMVPVGGAFVFAQQPDLLDKSKLFNIKFLPNIQEEPVAVPS